MNDGIQYWKDCYGSTYLEWTTSRCLEYMAVQQHFPAPAVYKSRRAILFFRWDFLNVNTFVETPSAFHSLMVHLGRP